MPTDTNQVDIENKVVTSIKGDLRVCPRSLSDFRMPATDGQSAEVPSTGRPKQPQRRKGNTKAAYSCPICRETMGLLENHLLECFTTFLSSANDAVPEPPSLPPPSFHPVLPMHLPPPVIPITSSTSSSSLLLSLKSASISTTSDDPTVLNSFRESSDMEDVLCPLCNSKTSSLKDHLFDCINIPETPHISMLPTTLSNEPVIHLVSPSAGPPPKVPPRIERRLKSPRKKKAKKEPRPETRQNHSGTFCGIETAPFQPPQLKHESSLPHITSINAGPVTTAVISPRREKKRWIHEAGKVSLSSTTHENRKRRTRDKKEKATPFNLPIGELPAPKPSQSVDNTVLKIPICTSAPTVAEVKKKYPKIDGKCFSMADIPQDNVVVVVCLENLALCRVTPEGKIFADGNSVDNPNVQFILKRKEGCNETKFKSSITNKSILSKDYFSEMNNYLTRFRKKQYHCLYYSKGTKEVSLGTGAERSMFRVFPLAEQPITINKSTGQ